MKTKCMGYSDRATCHWQTKSRGSFATAFESRSTFMEIRAKSSTWRARCGCMTKTCQNCSNQSLKILFNKKKSRFHTRRIFPQRVFASTLKARSTNHQWLEINTHSNTWRLSTFIKTQKLQTTSYSPDVIHESTKTFSMIYSVVGKIRSRPNMKNRTDHNQITQWTFRGFSAHDARRKPFLSTLKMDCVPTLNFKYVAVVNHCI